MHASANQVEPNLMVEGFRLVRRHRNWILLVSAVVLALGIAASLLMTRIYEAEVLVAYSSTQQGSQPLELLAEGLGGFAPLAALGLGEMGDSRAEAIATLTSRTLSLQFIERHGLMKHLFADQWDEAAGQWRGGAGNAPTPSDAFERFDEDVRTVSEDDTAGLIRVTIRGPDRELVASWANALVRDANGYLRERTTSEARNGIAALERALEKTDTLEIKQIIYGLIQTQLSNATLANTREDFAFRVIDAAAVPDAEDYVRPMPVLIIALCCVFGPTLGLMLALLHEAWSESNSGAGRSDR